MWSVKSHEVTDSVLGTYHMVMESVEKTNFAIGNIKARSMLVPAAPWPFPTPANLIVLSYIVSVLDWSIEQDV